MLCFFPKFYQHFVQYFIHFYTHFICYAYIDMVESVVVRNSDLEAYFFDVAEYFIPKMKYEDLEEMINQTYCQPIKARFTLIIDKSNSGSENRKPKLVLGCERSDQYKGEEKKLKQKDTGVA